MKLKDIMAAPESLTKYAGVESPDEQQLEQDFANMSFMFIQDRAAKLVPYMLGFEVVEREEDGSRAIGIFGFKIGEDYYYVPSFFVNQQIKGMDLLFHRDTNKFLPLTAEFIDSILDRKALRLGQGIESDDIQEDFAVPDFDFVREPPTGTKIASDWVAGRGHDAWNAIQENVVDAYQNNPEFQRDFASALAKVAGTELDGAADDNAICDYLTNYGGPQAVDSLMGLVGNNIKYANAALDFYGSIDAFKVTEFDGSLAPAEKKAEVEITTEVYSDMPDTERKRLVTHGIAVADNREPENKSELYDADYAVQFSNPCEGGRYEVLIAGGNTVEANVLMSKDGKGAVTVISDDGKLDFTADSCCVFVRGDRIGDVDKLYSDSIELDKLKPSSKYILVKEDGCASSPMRVYGSVVDTSDKSKIEYNVSVDGFVRYSSPTAPDQFPSYGSGCTSVKWLRATEDEGKRLRVKNETLIAPSKTWKAFELESDCFRGPVDETFRPGNPLDFEELLYKSAISRLDIHAEDGGSTYYIRLNDSLCGPYSVKQALHQLVCRYGLGAEDSDTLMKSACTGSFGKVRKLIKFAQMAGVQMPIPPYTQDAGTESQLGLPVVEPDYDIAEGQTTGLADPIDSATPGLAVGGELEQSVADLAAEASESGQKHVFDHATIGGLAKLYDTSAALDQYIPEMQKALDRVGRILFMFYWKNEDFESRYGADDMSDLEDTLRSVFKSFGHLTHMLEEKSIASSEGRDIQVA